jgi:mono/diheme cytochrome c family protein
MRFITTSMRNRIFFSGVLLSVMLILAACGGSSAPTPTPTIDPQSDAGLGMAEFKTNCAVCHSLTQGLIVVGPPLAHIGTIAATRIDGMSAEEYLRESIINPNAYTVDGFTEGTMRQDFGQVLTSDEVRQLVAYLMTLQ